MFVVQCIRRMVENHRAQGTNKTSHRIARVYYALRYHKIKRFLNHQWLLHNNCVLQTQSLLLANLALSDCIMGVYLIIIASADVYYRGNYALHDKSWKTGALCKVAGFLSTLSGEMSVLSLTVITIDRFIVLVQNSPLLKLSKKHVKGILGFM